MVDLILNDPALQAAQAALDGLSLRRNLIGQNIANVDTPGYRAQEIDFESALRRTIDRVGKAKMTVTNAAHINFAAPRADLYEVKNRPGGTMRADQNNVDVDMELTQLTETGIRYQALTTIVNKKMNILKSIATGR